MTLSTTAAAMGRVRGTVIRRSRTTVRRRINVHIREQGSWRRRTTLRIILLRQATRNEDRSQSRQRRRGRRHRKRSTGSVRGQNIGMLKFLTFLSCFLCVATSLCLRRTVSSAEVRRGGIRTLIFRTVANRTLSRSRRIVRVGGVEISRVPRMPRDQVRASVIRCVNRVGGIACRYWVR